MTTKPRVIALEEHYWDAEVSSHFNSPEARVPSLKKRLDDVGELRIREMDEAGIDVQVLSHGAPATQRMDAATAVPLARGANDRLQETCRAHPGRFEGFAVLPTAEDREKILNGSARRLLRMQLRTALSPAA